MRREMQAALVLLALAVAQAPAAADTDPSEKSCLGCHTPENLASLKKHGKRGPEVIPEDPAERKAFAALMAETARSKTPTWHTDLS